MNPKTAISAVVLIMLASVALAQSDRGSITGTITDTSSAVVTGVEVTATNMATKISTTVTSNELGFYSILNLPTGNYSVLVRKPGFRTYERKGITILVAQVVPIDVVLEVGGATETITVTEEATVLNTQTSDIGDHMTSTIVTDLPITVQGGRSLENFAYAITPGVEGNNWTSFIAGGAAFTKEVKIDGTSAVAQIGGHIGESSPSMEAVQEFQVETSGISAEDARTGGGVFNFALKSGTNKFHGSAFGFLHNEMLNANTWDNNFWRSYNTQLNPSQASTYAQEYRKPTDRQFDYGFSAGGPIIKNKTFIFGAFEKYTQQYFALGTLSQTVPIPAFLTGDFSALLNTSTQYGLDASGNPIYSGAIFDPGTGNVFVGNIIPENRISTVSQKVVALYQKYYTPSVPGLVNNDALTLHNDPFFHQTQFSVKVDHDFTSKNRLSGSYIVVRRPRTLVDSGGIWAVGTQDGGPLSRARQQHVNSDSARASDSHAFTPNVLNVASLTWNRYWNGSEALAASGGWPSALGFGSTGVGNMPEMDFGSAVNGVGETAIGYSSSGFYVANTYIVNDNLSWVKGRHTLKFGGESRIMQMNSISPAGTLSFNFSNMQTGAPNATYASAVGFGFASFLLGDVQSASEATAFNLYGRRKTLSLFAQDDVKVTPKLTMNVGLRWDFNGKYHEKYGHWANLNLATDRIEYAKSGSDSFDGKQYYFNFAPHIGAAYQLTSKAVLRASYGIFYSPINLNWWSGVPYGFAPGFRGTNTVPQTSNFSPAFNWDAGYRGQFVPGTLDPNYMAWGMVAMDPHSLEMGNIQQWNAGTEYALTHDLKLTANYIGNRGYHLQSGDLSRNAPTLATYTSLYQSGAAWSYTPVFDASPWPNVANTWGPLFFINSPKGNSDYNALQISVSKRAAHGVSAEMGYTLSRARGDVSSGFQESWWGGYYEDVHNLSREAQTILPYDQTHILKGYVAWELPFGRGRNFLSGANSFVNAAVSGWTVSTMLHYNSGNPIQYGLDSTNYYPGWSDFGYPIYLDVASNADFSRHFDASKFNPANPTAAGNLYFNPKAFANPANGLFGTGRAYYSELRGFGYADEDLGLMKYFSMGQDGRYKLSVRFEMYNMFNRHYFADPSANIGSPLFGYVTGSSGSPREGQFGARFQW
jgi:hypothetical protein